MTAQSPLDEATPLLAGARNGQVGHGEGRVSDVPASAPDIVPEASESSAPAIPRRQVALLCLARLLEPVAFFSIFPYVNQMVQDNGGVADTDVGFYSGLIESLFSLTQAAVMLGWGRAADRVGRKPVLVVSLAGLTGAVALFGLARSLTQMVVFRCVAGVFAGTVVTIRTMLAEHSTPATEARVFSWYAFSGNLGIFLGPLVGGARPDPLGRHGRRGGVGAGVAGGVGAGVAGGIGASVAGGEPFLATYPYALPGFVVAGLGAVAVVTTALYVEETRPRGGGRRERRGGEASTTPPPLSISQLLRAPGVGIVLYAYAHVMLLAFAYTALTPVFWFTPAELGGLGLTPLQISLLLGLIGISQAAWLLLPFPWLQRRVGTNGVMRLCAYAYAPFFLASPLLSMLRRAVLRSGSGSGRQLERLFWVAVPPLLAGGSGVAMSFTAAQLAVNEVAPSPAQLGTLNALALTGISAIRAFVPALFTSLYAVGARTQWLHGYAIWVLMVALALGFVVAVRRLPDYEALRKQRAAAEDEAEEPATTEAEA